MQIIEKWKSRETKKKLREENIILKAKIEAIMKAPYPVCTIEKNVQKVCATYTAKGGVPIEIVKQELSHNLMKYLSGFVEYDFENDRYGDTTYTAILYVATGDRRYES